MCKCNKKRVYNSNNLKFIKYIQEILLDKNSLNNIRLEGIFYNLETDNYN